MYERLVKSGFSDSQAEGLIAVIEELAEVFVTKDYLDARLAESEQRTSAQIRNWSLALVGLLVAVIALLLTS